MFIKLPLSIKIALHELNDTVIRDVRFLKKSILLVQFDSCDFHENQFFILRIGKLI